MLPSELSLSRNVIDHPRPALRATWRRRSLWQELGTRIHLCRDDLLQRFPTDETNPATPREVTRLLCEAATRYDNAPIGTPR
jgi:hypothetical protein